MLKEEPGQVDCATIRKDLCQLNELGLGPQVYMLVMVGGGSGFTFYKIGSYV